MKNHLGINRQQPSQVRRLTLALAATSLMAGCSSGGGNALDQSKITATSAEPIGVSALIMMERTLQLAAVSSEIADGVTDNGRAPSSSTTCRNAGTIDYQYTDSDQNGLFTAGDLLRASYRDCLTNSFQDPISGTVSMEISEHTVLSNIDGFTTSGLIVAEDLRTYNGDVVQFEMNGEVSFSSDIELLSAELVASSSGALTFRDPSTDTRDTLTDFEFRRSSDHSEARYEISARGEIDSEQRRATYRYSNAETLSGVYNTYPDSGALMVVGSDNTSVRMNANFVVNSASTQVEFMSASETKEVSIQAWNEHVSSFLWAYDHRQAIHTIEESGASFFIRLISRYPRRDAFLRAVLQSDSPISFQFDVPLNPSSVPTNFVLTQTAPFPATIPLQTEVQGALVILRPDAAFVQGASLRGPSAGGNSTINVISSDGTQGGQAALNTIFSVR